MRTSSTKPRLVRLAHPLPDGLTLYFRATQVRKVTGELDFKTDMRDFVAGAHRLSNADGHELCRRFGITPTNSRVLDV